MKSKFKQFSLNGAIRNVAWLSGFAFLLFIWIKIGQLVYPGLLSLELPGNISIPAGTFIAFYVLSWLGAPIVLSALPKRWSQIRQILVILLISIAARYAVSSLVLSDDACYCMYQGKQFLEGRSPFGLDMGNSEAVETLDGVPLQDESPGNKFKWALSSRTDPYCYPPLLLMFAGVIGKISYEPLSWRIVIFLADLMVIFLIILELRYRRLPLRLVLLYSLHPLVLTSFTGQGHPDVFLVLLLMVIIRNYRRDNWTWMFVALGLAVQVRYYPIILLPILVNRKNWKESVWTVIIGLGPLLPFLIQHGLGIFQPVWDFAAGNPYNSLSHLVFRLITETNQEAALISMICFVVIWLVGIWKLHPTRTHETPVNVSTVIAIVLCCLFLFLPRIHPWLLTILIPLGIFRYFSSISVLTLTISASFVADGYLHLKGAYLVPWGAVLIVWAPFIVLFLLDLHRLNSRRKLALKAGMRSAISVIIPVYNEQNHIRQCIEHALPESDEVIVIDGGSTDSSLEVSSDAGALAITHDEPMNNGGGRGGQIHAGLLEATSDFAVVLHADTLIQPGQINQIRELLTRNPEVVGGTLGSNYDSPTFISELLAAANDFRAGFLNITYGDQIQFFRREWVLASGIFPDIPLMEDVELSIRMRRLGPTVYLWGNAVVSAGRRKRGSWSRAMLLIRLTSAWLIHRMMGVPDPVAFYKTYYRK